MAQNQEARFAIGDRVQVFHAKDRMWRPGRVVETKKTGAEVKLDVGHQGFFYWASMSPVAKPQAVPTPRNEPPPLPAIQPQLLARKVTDPQPPNVNTRLVLLTPELAAELMARNEMNRRIKAHHRARLKASLKNGEWKFNGDTIRLTKSGRMCDGQHRCQVVIDTGIPIWVVLVEGLEEDVFDTIDIGARRIAADVLGVLGETNCRCLAGALNWVDKYFHGQMDKTSGVDTFTISDLLEEHRDLAESVRLAGGRTALLPPALMAALHYLFSKDDRGEADRFVKDLSTGASLAEDDGVYVLRERLMKNRLTKAKLPHVQIAALAIKAWNARRNAKPVRVLRWGSEGEVVEPFPVIHGGVRPLAVAAE